MTTSIKTYAQKSSAVRAAKKAYGEDFKDKCSIKGSDADGWYIETEKVVTIDPAPSAQAQYDAACEEAGRSLTIKEFDAKAAPVTPKLPVAILEAQAAVAEVELEEALVVAEASIENALTALHKNDAAHAALETDGNHRVEGSETSPDFAALMAQADKAANAQAANVDPLRPKVSTTELPTKKVWHIADEMMATNAAAGLPAPKRKEVIEECVRRGVAYGTARTQYQHWFKTMNDSAAAPIAKINKDGSIEYPGK